MFDFIRKVLQPSASPGTSPARRGSSIAPGVSAPVRRRSNGLKHFFESIPTGRSLEVLDLGGLSEANLSFLSTRGGRIHAVDLLEHYDQRRREDPDGALDVEAAGAFVDEYLNFPRNQFDAVMVWDALEFLDSDALYLTVPRLREVLRPGGALLSFFHTQSRGENVQLYRYRIASEDQLLLQPKEFRSLPNTFNNRSLERLFADFESVKFFLTRDSLREVIVSR